MKTSFDMVQSLRSLAEQMGTTYTETHWKECRNEILEAAETIERLCGVLRMTERKYRVHLITDRRKIGGLWLLFARAGMWKLTIQPRLASPTDEA